MAAQEETKENISISPELLRELVQALSQLRFGQLTLIVQDGRVIQMERTEKIRLSGAGSSRMCTP